MTRVKRGTTSLKRRRKVLKQASGYRFGRSTKERQATEALLHARMHAFAHRRKKKGDFRRLWQIKINASVREFGMSYSKFINAMKEKKIEIDRKILAELAEHHPEKFEQIVTAVK
jgi:large subunit ribosomal protein L20